MTSRTIFFASALALLLAACGDDTTGAGGSGASSGDGGGGGSVGDGGSTPSTTTTANGSTSTGGEGGSGGAGAGGDGAGGDGVGGAGGAGGAGSGGAPACDEEGFAAVAEDAFTQGEVFGYIAQTSIEGGTDVLTFEIYTQVGITGDREILDENYETCLNCVLIDRGCDENLANCEKTFLARSGTLSIDEFAGTFSGSLDGAELVEVTFDGNVSTPVEGGETWCLDGYTFEAEIQ